jgi:uncharacterized NAD(P)/FAD-binding protein YdhS
MKKSIAIIGGGFVGTILVRLLLVQTKNCKIYLFNSGASLSKGVAYNCNQNSSLLNVIASKMSAFPDESNHFLDWCTKHPTYKNDSRDIIASAFLPRKIYGEYLHAIWLETIELAKATDCELEIIEEKVLAIHSKSNKQLVVASNSQIECDKCVLATGNELPSTPKKLTDKFIESYDYFKNPWNLDFNKIHDSLPVLIIGNGLTMVDTVLSLRENNFHQKIISISPNGFNILPHRNFNFPFESKLATIQTPISLLELIHLFNLEVKKLKKFGVSPEPIIDAFRPNVAKVWQQFSEEEKAKFMGRVRHIWGVARHRIPFVSYDKIMKEQINQQLEILAGNLIEVTQTKNGNRVVIWDKRTKKQKELLVGAIINCTGPETNVEKSNNQLLKQLVEAGTISQDPLKLGLRTNCSNFKTINALGKENQDLYAIGSLLKGELWESTAVNELKNQAKELAVLLTNELPKT